MGSALNYLGLLFDRAAKKSVLLTDRLTILVVPFATLVLWLTGAKMTDSLQETLLLGVAITVLAVVILRLAAASYFLWKDDQAAKEELRRELEVPERDAEIEMKRYVLALRKELSAKLARLSVYAVRPPHILALECASGQSFAILLAEVDALINQLSYDFPVRVAAIQFRDACLRAMQEGGTAPDYFWHQRKITFRLLHKEDEIADFMSLMELEILLEDNTDVQTSSQPTISEMKNLLREIGDDIHMPELREKLRKALREHSTRV